MPKLTPEQAKALAESLTVEKWSNALDIGDGYTVRVKLEYDDTRLEDNVDWFGSIHWPERGNERQRPRECDGSARKIQTRDGSVWWSPPKDLVSDAENLQKLEKRVRGYFFDEWTYVVVVVEVTGPPCECCGERKSERTSLGAVESDARDYFAEVLADLVGEVNLT